MTLSRAGSRSQSEPSTQTLAEALTALCAEVDIPFEEMLHTVEGALAAAYTRAFNPPGEVTVKLDTKTGALDVRSRVVRPDGTAIVAELPRKTSSPRPPRRPRPAWLDHFTIPTA